MKLMELYKKSLLKESSSASLQDLKDELQAAGYHVTIHSSTNKIDVIGRGKGYFNTKKAKADSIVDELTSKGYNAESVKHYDGYYDIYVLPTN